MRYFIHSIAAAALLSTPAAATAQNQSDRSYDGQRQRSSQQDTSTERERADTEREDRQREASRRRSRSAEHQISQGEQRLRAAQRGRRSAEQRGGQDARQALGVRLSPSGWVRVATDYDNDGRFDAIETLFVYDLEAARERSRARADQEMRGEQRQMNRRQESAGEARGRVAREQQQRRGKERARSGREIRAEVASMRSRRADDQRRQAQLEGEIEQLREETLAGMDGAYWIARVRTDQGRKAKVLLGSKAELRSLQLSDGDQIRVTGKRGRINDKSMLIAETVRSGGDEVSVDLPSSRALKRVRGEILRKRTADFRGFDEPHVLAQVELVNGKQQTVNLGPQEKVNSLDLREGDRVSLLVRPGKVNGSPAMIAEQIRSGGKTVRLPRPEDTQRFRGAQREDRNAQERRS